MGRISSTIAFLCLVVISGIQPCNAQAEKLRLEHISVEDGLSQNSVFCIIQDTAGFMWFGTRDGLNRYNGHQFEIFQNNPKDSSTISGNSIRAAIKTRTGELWFGTEHNGLNYFQPYQQTFTRFTHEPNNPNSLSSDQITCLFEDQKGNIWVGTTHGLNRMSRSPDGTYAFFRYPTTSTSYQGNPGDFIRDIDQDSQGRIWVCTNANVFVLDPHTSPSSFRKRSYPVFGRKQILIDSYDNIWLGSYIRFDALFRYDAKTDAFINTGLELPNPIRSFIEVEPGILWLGAVGESKMAIVHLDSSRISKLDSRILPLEYIAFNTFYKDRGGTVWLGSNGSGIYLYHSSYDRFTYYTPPHTGFLASNNNSIRSIYTNEARLWVGGYFYPYILDRSTKQFYHPLTPEQIPERTLTVIYEDPDEPDKTLWLGTEGGGVYRYHKKTGQLIKFCSGLTPGKYDCNTGNISAIMKDTSGIFWIGSKNGLHKIAPETGKVETYYPEKGNPEKLQDVVTALFTDQEQTIWIGTRGSGLSWFDEKQDIFHTYSYDQDDPHSLPHNQIKCITQSQAGTFKGYYWIGTKGGGLIRMNFPDEESKKQPVFTQYTTRDGLSNDVVYGILEDNSGNLWMSTNKGISHFQVETGQFTNFNMRDGLQSDEFNTFAYHKSKEGEMFFGGINGLNSFFPEKVRLNANIPSIVLAGLKINNQVVELDTAIALKRSLTLGSGDRIFSISFAALDFIRPGKNTYSYWMEGLMDDWIQLGNQREVTFTNLDPGTYKLHVKATNSDGVWIDQELRVPIYVQPTWWQTGWFKLLVGMAFSIMLFLLYRLRLRYVMSQRLIELNEQLEAQVIQRTQKLEEQKRILSLIYDSTNELMALVKVDPDREHPFKVISINDQALKIIQNLGNNVSAAAMVDLDLETFTRTYLQKDETETHLFINRFEQVYTSKMDLLYEHEHIYPNGFKLVTESYLNPILDERGTCTHILYCARDITATKQAGQKVLNAILETEDRERKRIAKELHDTLGQNLTVSFLNFKSIKKQIMALESRTQGNYQAGLKSLDEAINESRSIAYNLMPKSIDDFGYELAVESMLNNIRRALPITLRFFSNLKGDRLDPITERSLYRITQEAVNNIVKHAEASEASIQLMKYPDLLSLMIEDNGIGFLQEKYMDQQTTIGLYSMKSRVQSLGGTLELDSKPGKGTLLSIHIPM